MAGGIVSAPATRDRAPDADDHGMVVRTVGPVGPVIAATSTLLNGMEFVVGAAAVMVLPANPTRKTAIVQNTGAVNIRVGTNGVTATTGLRLIPNQSVIYGDVTNDLWAIREGGADSIAFAQEAV